MEALQSYIKEISKQMPDVEDFLSKDIDEQALVKIDKKFKGLLPEEFKELYKTYNGAKEENGFMAGFSFLSLQDVIRELDYFKSDEYEYEPVGTEAISEKPMSKNKWVPFAFDGSECFLAVDLSPSKKGKAGQIIGLDLGYNRSYLMAESLNQLFERMVSWVKDGKLVSNNDDYVIEEKSGHLFNNIADYAIMDESAPSVKVILKDEFWINRYEKNVKTDENGDKYVSSAVLAKETGAFRIMNNPVNISCEPFQYMDKVKEMVIHNSQLRDFELFCKMPNLTRLYIIGCEIIDAELEMLLNLPKLKAISIRKMGDTESIRKLAGIKTLTELSIDDVEGFDYSALGDFKGLTKLSFKLEGTSDLSFLSNLKKMKNISIKTTDVEIDSIDFILDMPKLEEFDIDRAANNEEALNGLLKLNKLKTFNYPVKDLNVYKNHPSITCVGFAEDNNGEYQVFAGSKVSAFQVYCKSSENVQYKMKEFNKKMEPYVKCYSYSGACLKQ